VAVATRAFPSAGLPFGLVPPLRICGVLRLRFVLQPVARAAPHPLVTAAVAAADFITPIYKLRCA